MPSASVFKPSSTAAALLLTTVAAFGAGEIDEQVLQRLFALAALAGGEIEFQIDRVIGDFDHGIDRRPREQGAPQIGMENRARRIDDANMAGPAVGKNSTLDAIDNIVFTDFDGRAATLPDFHPQSGQ